MNQSLWPGFKIHKVSTIMAADTEMNSVLHEAQLPVLVTLQVSMCKRTTAAAGAGEDILQVVSNLGICNYSFDECYGDSNC